MLGFFQSFIFIYYASLVMPRTMTGQILEEALYHLYCILGLSFGFGYMGVVIDMT